jgi:hypothetical protein
MGESSLVVRREALRLTLVGKGTPRYYYTSLRVISVSTPGIALSSTKVGAEV